MAGAYYNEWDVQKAAWLRELIKQGLIADGDVDGRSIKDVRADDFAGYVQCHFFAGVGAWSYALRLAGWPDSRPVWTGSCPCQPFSAAGQRKGVEDDRHLFPEWFRLIDARRPSVVFGEQVASKHGLAWLDIVYDHMEGAAYTIRTIDLCSAGFGAPHIRQRLYFVADANDAGSQGRGVGRDCPDQRAAGARGLAVGLADSDGRNSAEGLQRSGKHGQRSQDASAHDGHRWPGPVNGFWSDADWLRCRDAKWRPVEPGTFPLAHGAPARVGRLRGYGDAINAQVAAEFVSAYLDTLEAA